MSTFQADTTTALLPLLAQYNLGSASVTPANGATFVVQAPPSPPPSAANFQIGFNIGGLWPTNSRIDDTGFSLSKLLVDMAPLGNGKILRAWGTCPLVGPIPDSQFTQTRIWATAGLQTIYVWNTQQNGKDIPTQAQVIAHFNSWPTAINSGVTFVELVNEHDNLQYLNQTPANLAGLGMLFATAGPILKAKGYAVIASNCLSSYGSYQDSHVKPSLTPKNVDYIGRHGYAGDAATATANVTKVKLFADSLGLGFCQTEAGLREANYVVELPKYWQAMQALGGIHIAFTLYQISTSPTYGYQNQPYTTPDQPSTLYAPLKAVLGVH